MLSGKGQPRLRDRANRNISHGGELELATPAQIKILIEQCGYTLDAARSIKKSQASLVISAKFERR